MASALMVASGNDPYQKALAQIGADNLRSYQVTGEDTHGGFLGDGETHNIFSNLEAGQVARVIGSPGWSTLPLSHGLACTLYGEEYHGIAYDAWFHGILPIEAGAWFFLDKQNPKKSYDDAEIYRIYAGSSANIVIGLYDAQTQAVHYLAFDS